PHSAARHAFPHLPGHHSFPTRRSSDLPHLDLQVSLPPRHRLKINRFDRFRRLTPHAPHPKKAPRRSAGAQTPHATHLASGDGTRDRKSTRLNSSHVKSSYAVFGLKKKT